jgi:hypothetical protein
MGIVITRFYCTSIHTNENLVLGGADGISTRLTRPAAPTRRTAVRHPGLPSVAAPRLCLSRSLSVRRVGEIAAVRRP